MESNELKIVLKLRYGGHIRRMSIAQATPWSQVVERVATVCKVANPSGLRCEGRGRLIQSQRDWNAILETISQGVLRLDLLIRSDSPPPPRPPRHPNGRLSLSPHQCQMDAVVQTESTVRLVDSAVQTDPPPRPRLPCRADVAVNTPNAPLLPLNSLACSPTHVIELLPSPALPELTDSSLVWSDAAEVEAELVDFEEEAKTAVLTHTLGRPAPPPTVDPPKPQAGPTVDPPKLQDLCSTLQGLVARLESISVDMRESTQRQCAFSETGPSRAPTKGFETSASAPCVGEASGRSLVHGSEDERAKGASAPPEIADLKEDLEFVDLLDGLPTLSVDYLEKIERLRELGFPNATFNAVLLKLFEGDLDRVLHALKKHHSKR